MSELQSKIVAEALKAAAQIGVDMVSSHAFDAKAARTGTLLYSTECYARREGASLWCEGRMAVTSNVIIVRTTHPMGPLVSGVNLNVPTRTFRFKEEDITAGLIPRRAIAFRDTGVRYNLFGLERQRFAEAIGRARRLLR